MAWCQYKTGAHCAQDSFCLCLISWTSKASKCCGRDFRRESWTDSVKIAKHNGNIKYTSGAQLKSFFSLTLIFIYMYHYNLPRATIFWRNTWFLMPGSVGFFIYFFIQGTLHFREWIRHFKHPGWLLIQFLNLIFCL